ncbi:diguanylate cyclase [Pseudomonas plecoglossicida]|uniref:Diguanylate cyclase n=1 Tax=Pseudomonas plecoglossicida TaxID=70775 RepID=A0A2R7UBU2_PSEDL|nr:diguanylate cyclase [Pseudomonas plecoglossicida]
MAAALQPIATPVGAGAPANTGAAGAMHRVGFFAGAPAPTAPPYI